MKLTLLIIASALTVALASDHVWQTGKVLDASKTKNLVESGATVNATSTTMGPVTNTTGRIDTQSTTVSSTYLVVVGSEFVYTVADTRTQDSLIPHAGMAHTAITQAIGNRHHGCRFIVNDEVKFYQDKSTLHVIDADRKECSTEILRQERIVNPAATQAQRPDLPAPPQVQSTELPAPPPPRPTLRHDANPQTDADAYQVGPAISQPAVLFKADPAYTPEALAAKLSGAVVLAIIVGADGKAHNVRVLRGLGMGLDEKAVEAVEQWHFRPGMKDGQAVNVRAQIEVNFRLRADKEN
jgi:TonB family protein